MKLIITVSATVAMFLGQIGFFSLSIPALANDMQDRYREKWTVSPVYYASAQDLNDGAGLHTTSPIQADSWHLLKAREELVWATTMHQYIAKAIPQALQHGIFVSARILHLGLCLDHIYTESAGYLHKRRSIHSRRVALLFSSLFSIFALGTCLGSILICSC